MSAIQTLIKSTITASLISTKIIYCRNIQQNHNNVCDIEDKPIAYENMFAEEILQNIPPNSEPYHMDEYVKEHIDFYKYFSKQLYLRHKMEFGEYEDCFSDWFAAFLTYSELSLYNDDNWPKAYRRNIKNMLLIIVALMQYLKSPLAAIKLTSES